MSDAADKSPGSGGETAAAPPPLPSAPPPLPPSRRETPTVRIPVPEPRQPFLPAQTPRSGGVTPLVDGDLVAGVIRDLALSVQRLENSMHRRFDAIEPAEPEEPEPTETNTPPETIPPPSKRQAAAIATVNLAKWGTLAIGVLGIAAQVAKVWRPSLVAPLDQAIALFKQLTGAP